jgi:chitodextrinase
MATPKPGTAYVYSADAGLAARARVADPGLSDELPTEMAALDLAPGTAVTVAGYDKDRDLVLVDWTDGEGTSRTTSVEPDVFTEHFTGA